DAAGDPLPDAPGYQMDGLATARGAWPWCGSFARFARLEGGDLACTETSWGNWLLANCLHGTDAAKRDRRFAYAEDGEAMPGGRDAGVFGEYRVFIPDERAPPLGDWEIAFPPGDEPAGRIGAPWSARYWRLRTGHCGSRLARILVQSDAPDALIQVVLRRARGAGRLVRDILRGEAPRFERTVNLQGVADIIVVVGNRAGAGGHRVSVTPIPAAPLVRATRWNCARDTSYEMDPAGWAWTWTSPDLMADANGDGRPDLHLRPGRTTRLRLRATNHGTRVAAGVTARFACRPALLPGGRWEPIGEATLAAPLPPGGSAWIEQGWTVPEADAPAGWMVRAELIAAEDPNRDDKIVVGCVGGASGAALPAMSAHAVPRAPDLACACRAIPGGLELAVMPAKPPARPWSRRRGAAPSPRPGLCYPPTQALFPEGPPKRPVVTLLRCDALGITEGASWGVHGGARSS
ncbi:MAG TPA: hypothetical protein VD970_18210, partial [Acetobacteraceae bacterium]|nr:hypothetical protein [Acetobacteraceae bacterium]